MMQLKWKSIIFGLVLLLISFPSALAQQGTVTPSSVSVPRGQASVVRLTYRLTGILYSLLRSPGGQFLLGSKVLGSNTVPLTVTIPTIPGSGTVTETLTIPQDVIERSFRAGSATFRYERTFNAIPLGLGWSINVNLSIKVVSGAAAPFSLRRVELYFENRRGEITIPRTYSNLRAFADVRFNGSGLLEGYWQVDGRTLNIISEHITFGGEITLESPETPPLPTFETGYHTVRLVITNPQPGFPLPEIVYFVTSEMCEQPLKSKIDLISPEDNATLPFAPARFLWQKVPPASIYLVEFREEGGSKPLFSALTKEPSYIISSPALTYFLPDKPLLWVVKGFNSEGKTLAESGIRVFRFQSP